MLSNVAEVHGSTAIGNPWVGNTQCGKSLTADVAHVGYWSKSGRKMEPGAHKKEAMQQVSMAIVRKAHLRRNAGILVSCFFRL